MKVTLAFGHAQAWIAGRRKAALGTWQWSLWLAVWLPFRIVFCGLYTYQRWVHS